MAVGALLIAGIATAGYFGVRAWKVSSQEAKAKELAAKIVTQGPGGFEEIRKAVDSGQITREQAWSAGREAMEARMQKEMDGFFGTPAKDRDKYLDKLIDEIQKRMKEMEARRAAEGPTTRPNWGGPPRDGNGPTTRPDRGPGGGGGRGDNASPVQRAQRQEFMAAMMRRMQERGIQMGRGMGMGGWGRGGGGGGPGGGNRGNGGGR